MERVSAHDVLRHFGVSLRYSDDTQEEQILCPFHSDSKPSARVYPQEGNKASGLYCYTCQKRWDIINLWREFHGDPERKYTLVLRELEKAFGIITPESPDLERGPVNRGPSDAEIAVRELLTTCERRLKMGKSSFTQEGFLKVGKVMDRLYYQLDHESIELEQAEEIARKVLAKIAEKIRSV